MIGSSLIAADPPDPPDPVVADSTLHPPSRQTETAKSWTMPSHRPVRVRTKTVRIGLLCVEVRSPIRIPLAGLWSTTAADRRHP